MQLGRLKERCKLPHGGLRRSTNAKQICCISCLKNWHLVAPVLLIVLKLKLLQLKPDKPDCWLRPCYGGNCGSAALLIWARQFFLAVAKFFRQKWKNSVFIKWKIAFIHSSKIKCPKFCLVNTIFASRVFTGTAPSVWNSLPAGIHACLS